MFMNTMKIILLLPILYFNLNAAYAAISSATSLGDISITAVSTSTFTNSLPNSLLDYQNNVNQYVTSSSENEMNILIIEATEPQKAETVIFLNGTSQVLPDWNIGLIKELVGNYNLLFMDYPGIGGTPSANNINFNFTTIANDINEILNTFPDSYSNITGYNIHLVGWSLGTLAALKSIIPLSEERTVKNVVLFSSKPGGEGASPLGTSYGNQAPCVTDITTDLLKQDDQWNSLAAKLLKINMFKVMFPYQDQELLNSTATYNDCTTHYKGLTLTHDIESILMDKYKEIRKLFHTNRKNNTIWKGGIPSDVYNQERQMVIDWNTYSELDDNYDINNDTGNYAICKTLTLNNLEVISKCPDLSGKVENITVIHGQKDMFIQYKFGESLVNALNAESSGIATFELFEDAGHAYFLQESYQLIPSMFE